MTINTEKYTQIKSQCLEISLMHIKSCKVANEDEGTSVEDQKSIQ